MNFETFINDVQHLPVIQSEYLTAGQKNRLPLEVQLSRWKSSGKIIQLKRGVYILAEPYRKKTVFEFYIAGILTQPSYISLEKAFEFHDLIPEAVNTFTSVTSKAKGKFLTPIGRFEYRHLHESLFWGYQSVTLHQQTAFVALPEKALLDFFYLLPFEPNEYYLNEMRLQNLDLIDPDRMIEFAYQFGKPKLRRIAEMIISVREEHLSMEKVI